MGDDKVRVVFDCNLYVQALVNPDSPAADCLELALSGKVEPFISRQTLAELKEVLQRPKILRLFPHATLEQIEAFLGEVVAVSTHIRRIPARFAFDRDPKDEPYINLAIAADADYIISRDKDLLDLMTGHTKECKEFRQRFRRLRVIRPQEFLRIVSPAKEE
jgi:uncharacterized protein